MHVHHPSAYLKSEWVALIRDETVLAEQTRSLTARQLKLIYEQNWFKMFMPPECANMEMSLPAALQLEEALSWADGSLGWTVTLCSGAGWFSGFFSPELSKAVLNTQKVCLGGSGAANGQATRVDGGYLISGCWKYATGAAHLTHFTANCILMDDGEMIKETDGSPLIRPFVFKRDEVKIKEDWKTIGLIATSSQSFEVDKLFVSSSRCFKIAPEARTLELPIYKYPFLQFAELTLAVNISGMAMHFIDCCEAIFWDRIKNKRIKEDHESLVLSKLSEAKGQMSIARTRLYQSVKQSWELVESDLIPAADLLDSLSAASRNLASTSHSVVDSLYPFCGMAAADPSSEINRVWRDIHTASQHNLLTLS